MLRQPGSVVTVAVTVTVTVTVVVTVAVVVAQWCCRNMNLASVGPAGTQAGAAVGQWCVPLAAECRRDAEEP